MGCLFSGRPIYFEIMNSEWNEKYSVASGEITNRLRNLSKVAQEATLSTVLALNIKNPKVLEIGCGTGQHSVALARCSPEGEFVATDSSESAIAETRALAYAADVQVKSCVADILQLPFDDSKFDVVFGDHVIAHVPNIELALHECFRVVKPGGYLVINASNALRPDGWKLYHALTPMPYLWRDFFPWKLHSLVTGAGFSEKELWKYYLLR